MTVKERLINYLKFKHVSNSQFCRNIGVSEGFINSMRKSMQPDKIESIAAKYPELNISWLLTGEGEMINGDKAGSFLDNKNTINQFSKIDFGKVLDILKKQADSLAYKDELLRKKDEQIQKMIDDMNNQTKKLNEKIFSSHIGMIEQANRQKSGIEEIHRDVPTKGNDDIEEGKRMNVQNNK